MPLGSFVRKIAGPLEVPLCDAYRAVFVNMKRCVRQMEPGVPHGAVVVEVGGGDGVVADELLKLRPDMRVVMLDIRPSIGRFITTNVRDRVELHPSTSVADFLARGGGGMADVLVLSDVVHHVPPDQRRLFMRDCVQLLRSGGRIVIKDIEPKGFVAWLAQFTDKWITGDRHVSQLGAQGMRQLVATVATFSAAEQILSDREAPNYALAFEDVESLPQ